MIGAVKQAGGTMNSKDAFVVGWMAAAPAFSVLVELSVGEHAVTIENIRNWPADKGNKSEATGALATLCHLADAHQVTLLGYSGPYAAGLEHTIRLRLWLARNGFEPASGEGEELRLFRTPRDRFGIPSVSA
jgi:hypothetical protein